MIRIQTILTLSALAALSIPASIHAQSNNSNPTNIKLGTEQREVQRDTNANTRTRVQDIPEAPTRPYQPENETQAKVLELQKQFFSTVTDLQIEKVPAQDALKILSEKARLPLDIDWKSLKDDHQVDLDRPITMKIQRISVQRALTLIFRELMDEAPIYELTPEALEIKSKAKADRRLLWRVYKLGDLAFEVDRKGKRYVTTGTISDQERTRTRSTEVEFDSEDGKDIDDRLRIRNQNQRTQVNNSGTMTVVRDDVDVIPPREKARRVVLMIQDQIERDGWVINGGKHNSVKSFLDKVVVTAPLYVHQQIAKVQHIHHGKPGNGGEKHLPDPAATNRGGLP